MLLHRDDAPARAAANADGPATRGGPWRLAPSGLWLPVWWPRPVVARTPALADVERIVDSIAWSPRNPLVRRAIEERARADGCSVAEVRRRELRAALYLALAERGRAQTHRFGRRWLTDEQGRAAAAVPEQLAPELFERWLTDEARKAAEASLLGHTYPGPRPAEPAAELPDDLPGGGPDPLFILLAQEERAEAQRRWRQVVGAASPRQRELLATMVDQLRAGAEPSPTAAAARLGIAESTARVQWKRLVDRQRGV